MLLLLKACSLMQECYSLTSSLLEHDPYAIEVYPVHITASLELGKKNELFRRAHKYASSKNSKDRNNRKI